MPLPMSLTWPVAGQQPASVHDRVQVLFLGDDGHHVPRERAAAANVPLFQRDIQIEYTEDVRALEPANLGRFDVVLIYANTTVIEKEQEAALLEFVRDGGGLVALHCASYCFLNSPAYVELVGGQFSSHGRGTFTTRTVAPEHAVMQGYEGFTSWDETYVHTRHGDDRTILAVRERAADEPGGAGDEPWTWIREEGQGRVFYTAWGHDLRTWNQPGFIDLVARGTRWAAGKGPLDAVVARPPLEFIPTETGVPDYVPGQRTSARKEMQAPLSPADSMQHLAVAPGLEARLFASEPMLQGKPIHMAFDERGRAWVLETIDYPNERKDEGGLDRISILEDTDGDGTADRRTVFAEGLSIPTSLTFARGGVVVTQAPDTLFLRDTDGDDVADERTVLFRGWGTGDTHAGPSNLRLGPDNRIWGTVGYSGFRGKVGDETHQFSQAIFAFEPDGSALEVIASTTNNTWGLGFSEEASLFASTANGNPSVHAAVPARYYERVPGLSPGALQTIAERMELHPVTDRVRQVDFHGKYTAAAGHSLYTARLFPRRYWNRIAFVNSPTGHTIGQFELEHAGSDYVARDGWNLLASDDEWTAPTFSEVGPDGAVWVIDWYNYIVQHNPTPPGFETGKGNAYVSDLRDKKHGRIWRLVPIGADVPAASDLSKASPEDLVQLFGDENFATRQHAQRLLVERGELDVFDQLTAWLAVPNVDGIGSDPAALHSLWSLAGLGAFDGTAKDLGEDEIAEAEDALVRSLRHPAWSVRRAALELLPRAEWARDLVLSSGILNDSQAKVRLAALLALSEMPTSDEAGAAAFDALVAADEADDRWLGDAATIAAAAHDAGFLKALLCSRQAAAARSTETEERPNLVRNGSFETGSDRGLGADHWSVRTYGGEASQAIVSGVAHSGERSLRISSETGADSSAFTEIKLEPTATYRLSAWIKTEGFDRATGRGALLNVHELQSPEPVRTEGLEGTEDWRQVSVEFNASGRNQVSINCLLGGWGWSRGVAYYDDVVVERIAGDLLGGAVGRALPRVMRAYAARGPSESIVSTLARLGDAPPALAGRLLEGLASGWPASVVPGLDEADRATLSALARSLDADTSAQLVELLGRWNVDLGGAVDIAELTRGLAARVASGDEATAARIAAAERLVSLAGRDADRATLAGVLAPLEPNSEPDLAAGLVRALGASSSEGVAEVILAAWPRLGPQAQRAASATLLRRDSWSRALLARIADGTLPASVIDAVQWSQLGERAATGEDGDALAALVAAARGAAADPDRAAVIEAYRGTLTMPSDPERGHQMFSQHCAKCHVIAGEGARLGPELDGIGARAPEELLIAILDPNRSVEGTYQLWTARTAGGEIVAGRLVSETRTSIELVDANGESHLLERSEVAAIVPSKLSLMPAGLEADLGEQGMADLLAFLARQH
ncbi:Trehalose utilization [Planctomycetes bacterium Poly30]|uniref:Trehalose utilization n=2 Tax=Saltatorellus ferox TaxID=2528018 RepID=A0A518EPN4_9BACT|nr:Trehalose utilization [Planctomycetes bacterium Poly30]